MKPSYCERLLLEDPQPPRARLAPVPEVSPMTNSENDVNNEVVFQGVAAAPGVAHGPAFVFTQHELDVPEYRVPAGKHEAEVARFEEALLKTRQQITKIRNEIAAKLGESEAQIFDAHLLVVEDKALIDETIHLQVTSGLNIEHCFFNVAQRFIDFFDSVDDEYLRERVGDIRDVTRRILQNLLGKSDFMSSWLASSEEPKVIVSNMINASDVAGIGKENTLGFVSSLGGRTSHAVIMARSMEIPAVVGIPDLSDRVDSGETVLIDGYEGIVVLRPSEETLYRYGQVAARRKDIRDLYISKVGAPSETRDGHHIAVSANIEGVDDVDAVLTNHSEGVGLFRTETLFMRGKAMQSEESQFVEYRAVAERLAPNPVVIRTLDLGGDKMLPGGYSGVEEDNPFMGFRAIRYCLKNPDVFKQQLRAILRASAYGNVAILYPMISGVRELIEANTLLEECKEGLRAASIPFSEAILIGSMIEIPSAALTVDVIAEHCDFLSIGTNDLIQYLLAVDRVNDKIAHLYDPSHPAVMRTLSMIFEAAKKAKVKVSVCGEMGGDPLYIPYLIGLGAGELSMSPSLIPEAKYLIRAVKQRECRMLAEEVLSLGRPRKIFARLQSFYRSVMGDILDRVKV